MLVIIRRTTEINTSAENASRHIRIVETPTSWQRSMATMQ